MNYPRLTEKQIQQRINIIKDGIHNRLTLRQIAKVIGISPPALQFFFERYELTDLQGHAVQEGDKRWTIPHEMALERLQAVRDADYSVWEGAKALGIKPHTLNQWVRSQCLGRAKKGHITRQMIIELCEDFLDDVEDWE